MAKWDQTSVFHRRYRKLDRRQQGAFRQAVNELNGVIETGGFVFPRGGSLDLHTYSGFERPPALWSMDFATDGDHRALFTIDADVVIWQFIGTHAEIVRWQKEIGPRGLRKTRHSGAA